ncbi:MAG: tetratricopeptide repeat protein [Thermoanaerobaculia bacterium]
MRTWTPGAVAVLASLTVGGCGEVERDLSSLRAVNAFEEGRWDLARAWSERAIAEGTEGLEIRRLAARAWSRGPFQISSKQAEAWRRVLDLVPDDPEALLALAQALDTLDDPAASEVLERAPDGVDVSRLRGRMELRRDPTAARATLERAVNEFPDDAQLAAELAQACALSGDRSAALRWASRALDLDPQDRGSRQLRGRLLAIEGRRDEAAREIEIHELLTIVAGDQGAASATPLERVRALRRLRDLTSLDTPEIRATEVDLLLQAGLPGEAAPSRQTSSGTGPSGCRGGSAGPTASATERRPSHCSKRACA